MIEEKEHQWHDGFPTLPRGMTVLPWLLWATIVCGVIGALWAGKVFAEPMFAASQGNVTITVYSEKCAHLDQVTNAPNRATWKEGDKVYDGCVGAIPELGVAYFWFEDKTVAVVPLQMFEKVTGV